MIGRLTSGAASVLAATLIGSALGFSALAEPFDKPVRTKTLDLGSSIYLLDKNPAHVKLSCFYYPMFMIKQLDDPGLKGAESIAIVPTPNGNTTLCRKSPLPGERSFTRWSGYFHGVKENLVFIDAADGTDGGMPFIVFDWAAGRTIFEDSALFWDGHDLENDPEGNIQFLRSSSGKLVLHYRRVVVGVCSIPLKGKECWVQARRRFHLLPGAVPKCTGYRYPGMQEWTEQNPTVLDELDAPSVFAYPVEVTLATRPSIRPVSGRLTCSAVD